MLTTDKYFFILYIEIDRHRLLHDLCVYKKVALAKEIRPIFLDTSKITDIISIINSGIFCQACYKIKLLAE